MKFYEFIESLQSLNPNKIIMIKTGAFFNSIGRDAIILEYTLGLKRSCFAKGLCKVGFPVSYVRDNLEENYGQYVKIYNTEIPKAINTAKSSSTGKSIFEFDKNSTVAEAYNNLAKEVLDSERTRTKNATSKVR